MRTNEDKVFLQSRFKPSYAVNNFLSSNEIKQLVDLYYSLNDSDKLFKNTGPVTSSILHNPAAKSILENLQEKIFAEVGRCTIYNASFFKVDRPHIIHNDDLNELPLIYKAFTIPLEIILQKPDLNPTPNFITFNQYYLDGPAKFFKGGTDLPSFYNKLITDYSNVIGLDDNGVSVSDKEKYLSHLEDEWLDGLSVENIFPWIPGNAIVFDCPRLHAASDFRLEGIKSKLGLSIFTYTERQ